MPGRGVRRLALAALVVVVAVLHGWIAGEVAGSLRVSRESAAMPARMAVAYVREMQATAPPVVVPAAAVTTPAPAPRRVASPRRVVAASAPAVAASAAAPEPVQDAAVVEPEATVAASAPAVAEAQSPPASAAAEPSAIASAPAEPPAPTTAVAAANAASAAPGDQPFDWPVSTRLSYRLTGYFRGDVEGEAQVEWVRSGARYQVHLDVQAGLPAAPLFTRRMSSDGDITAAGLAPRRYDQDTKQLFRDRKRDTLLFEPDSVVLANGDRRDTLAGVQDTASQFVQLSYLFATRPDLLRVGAGVEFPLALPRKLDRWAYDVVDEETLAAPFGALPTFHLKPRREVRGGDLGVEMWLAPSLRYLPVRIRIRQDAETYIDLMITRRPEIAAVP